MKDYVLNYYTENGGRSIFVVAMTSVVSWPGQAGPGVWRPPVAWLTHERERPERGAQPGPQPGPRQW